MSQKSDIEEMLQAGRGYDEIEDETGSTRSYIRSIAVQYRANRQNEREPEDEIPEEDHREPEPQKKDKKPSMTFVDDETPQDDPKEDKTGADHHKAWVKAAKYECGNCGATIGRNADFCGHCGKSFNWEGVE